MYCIQYTTLLAQSDTSGALHGCANPTLNNIPLSSRYLPLDTGPVTTVWPALSIRPVKPYYYEPMQAISSSVHAGVLTMALVSTQPLTKMSTKNISWVPGIFPGGKGGRCVGLTTLPPSCADCLEIWEPEPPEALTACPGLYKYCFIFTFYTGVPCVLPCFALWAL